MENKLIIFAGGCPGVGKSTLSSFLFNQLSLKGTNSRWIYEDEVSYLDTFTEVVEAFYKAEYKVLDALIVASRKLVAECKVSESIYITDSVFPFFNWLFAANFTQEAISKFSTKLQPILEELNPLVVYIDCDVSTSFKRALAQRGAEYQKESLEILNRYSYFQARSLKASNLCDIIDYFERVNKLNLDLLNNWHTDKLILFSQADNLRDLKQTLLRYFSLEEIVPDEVVAQEALNHYIGVYERIDGSNAQKRLEIRSTGNKIYVDTYWPAGCRLVPETSNKFVLEATNEYLLFNSLDSGEIIGLTYVIGESYIKYEKVT